MIELDRTELCFSNYVAIKTLVNHFATSALKQCFNGFSLNKINYPSIGWTCAKQIPYASSVDPGQRAPTWILWSGSLLFEKSWVYQNHVKVLKRVTATDCDRPCGTHTQ